MATVDIEPASLAVTPGESEVLTLTVGNDSDDIEAYHLTAVDDAAAYVVIKPDTLLVHPGETVTAAATLTLEHTGRWRQGDLIVRFHIVPAGRPDEFLVVEAIATIQSFSDVAAVLTPPALEGRRSARAAVTIANAGNAHTYAEVSVSAGELALSIDQSRAALPGGSTESVGLSVHARSVLWRGEPVQHPFVVTVTPEGGQAISLDGSFTQRPVFARWMLATAIPIGAVAVVALLVWLGALVLGGIRSTPVAVTPSATPSETTPPPPPEPDVRLVVAATAADALKAGDPLDVVLQPVAREAPRGSLLAVEVEWPEGLRLTDDECEAWIAREDDRVLQGGPRSGDECVIELSSGRNDARLTFATPPAGFTGALSAGATRLVTLDDGTAATVETGPDSDFGDTAAAEIALEPYLFWMEVVDGEPAEWAPDATVIIHHLMRGDGTDEETTMSFQIVPPAFADRIIDTNGCDRFDDSICSVYFSGDPDEPTNTTWEVGLWFEPRDARGIGPLSVAGTALTDVPPNEVSRSIRGAEGLVVSERMFGVDVRLDSDEDLGQGEQVTATIDVTPIEPVAELVAYAEGSWKLALALEWPEGFAPVGTATGCTLVDRVCTLPGLDPGEKATITMAFVVQDPFAAGEIGASGATLGFDPTTDADRRDGRERPTAVLPPHWIGSDREWFPL